MLAWISSSSRRVGLALAVVSLLAAGNAAAGIPQPGIILYGQVFDEGGNPVYNGALIWEYDAPELDAPVQTVTTLRQISAPGGPFSYSVLIPLSSEAEGYPVEAALAVGGDDRVYTRTATVEGTAITMTHQVTVGAADMGSVVRVDVCETCAERTEAHSADLDEDFKFSLAEVLRVFALHGASETHEYHYDPGSSDGYGVGPGPKDGPPHSADFFGGADWRISMPEVVRMIDLYASTSDHAYHASPLGDDGFSKGLPAQGTVLKAQTLSIGGGLQIERGMVGLEDGGVLVTLDVRGYVADRVTGLGIMESMAPGWAYEAIPGEALPFMAPPSGETGLLEFAWFPVPELPFQHSYVIYPQDEAAWVALEQGLEGTAFYRTQKSNHQAEVLVAARQYSGPADSDGDGVLDDMNGDGIADDMDGDGIPDVFDTQGDRDGNGYPDDYNANGIPDVFEGYIERDLSPQSDLDGDTIPDAVDGAEDSDGDGIPNYLDLDSDNDGLDDAFEAAIGSDPTRIDTDNDGLTDAEEVGYGGNVDTFDPYSPEGNASGVDLDPVNPDTDGDGTADALERDFGFDPINEDIKAEGSLPVSSPGAMALLVLLLTLAAAQRFTRGRKAPVKASE